MRIPSQFTEDNLYRRENRGKNSPRSRSQADVRRIFHLLIGLGLILVMMRQASKPEIYETFFGAIGPQANAANKSPSDGPKVSDIGPQAAGETQIDPKIIASVADGTVWRSGDFEALYWCLNDARTVSVTLGPVVGVVPLLQQPDIYLNRSVRSRGRVVRCERIEAKANDYGITEYWQLWIRPSAGADRPMVVIVEKVPDQVAAIESDGIDENGPTLLVAGRFLKRLAYRSSVGADLAPVIVGKLVTPWADATDSRDQAVGARFVGQRYDSQQHDNQPRLWLLIGLSTIIGMSLAALAMWRTSVTANRTRQLRSRAGAPISIDFSYEDD